MTVTTEDMRKKSVLWVHLNTGAFLNEHANGYDAAVPDLIKQLQLKKKMETPSWEEWLREKSQNEAPA